MATAPTRPTSPTQDRTPKEAWSATERAEYLGRHRPQLLSSLPFKVSGARDLAPHRREEVLDEAILYVAFEHSDPVYDEEILTRILWTASRMRVGSALRGRSDTIRGRFRAVDSAALATVPADGADPAAIAEQRVEWETLLEFARRLEPLERAVVFKRYERAGANKVHGYATIARELGQPEKEVRSALRTVQHKLDAYSLVIADRQSFERRLAELLPAPIVVEQVTRPSGWRETLLDWLGRPFGHDATAAATTLASSGGGRGLGTLTALACLGATGAGGTYCAITGNLPLTGPDRPTRVDARPRPTPPPRASTPAPVRRNAQIQAAIAAQAAREAAERRENRERRQARRSRAAERTAATEARTERQIIARDTREAEQAPVAPAPPSASGNDFDFEQTGPSQPAPPAPAPATGGGEFLP